MVTLTLLLWQSRIHLLPLQVELYQFLRRSLAGLHGLTLLLLLALTLLEPLTGPDRLPNWVLVLLFAAYDLLIAYGLRRWTVITASNGEPGCYCWG
ncbi:MAG: hypothetical protein M3Z04_22925 [Chloroflexota bacterium]|nr:hypothetical protein [Chloroflexota bacterium]